MPKIRINIGFIIPPTGAIGGPPSSEEWFDKKERAVMKKLSKMFPEIEFTPTPIREQADVNRFLEREDGSTGYLLFVFNCVAGLVRPILHSSKPTIIIGETYGGAGEYLMEYSRARRAGMPVVGTVTRDVSNEAVLRKVELFEVIQKLRGSRILFVVTPSEKWLMDLMYPLGVDLYSTIKSLQSVAGILPITQDIREFTENYYNKVNEDEAKAIANDWVENAERNLEEEMSEIIKSAKLYLAMKKATEDFRADAIALDCIVLRNSGLLDAWPCLGYMKLWNENVIPVCEADPCSAFLLLVMKYLANRPGFISDPSPDDLEGEVVYYHCYAPTKPYGPTGKAFPYTITPAHLKTKHASIHVRLPVDETITAVGFIPDEKTLTVHTARAVKNEFSQHACAVKLVGKTDTRALAENWKWRSGWHRVVFYGDWRENLKDLAALLGLEVVEEDTHVYQ